MTYRMRPPRDVVSGRGSIEQISEIASSFAPKSIAFTVAVHALSYPLGERYRIPHSLSNAILPPWVMDFNRDAVPERFAQVAAAMKVTRLLDNNPKPIAPEYARPIYLKLMPWFGPDHTGRREAND